MYARAMLKGAARGAPPAQLQGMARTSPAKKLAKYRSMRDFTKTAEPADNKRTEKARATARKAKSPGRSFVIQKHAASHLHYDFRLELDGVLLSWSVPKGPSLKPAERRLAVQTEDHPLDYAGFEGIIPKGEYGGGTVVVWDRGTWEPDGDPRAGMDKGHLKFTLHGEKLLGAWHLVRTKGRGGSKPTWILFKSKDEHSNEVQDITAMRPESVITGRTVEEIAAAPDKVWHSNRGTKQPVKLAKKSTVAASKAAGRRRIAKGTGPVPVQGTAKTQAELLELVGKLPLGFKTTSLDRVLWPEQGTTKGELMAYLAVVADWMLPHVANRPLTLVRCPEGHTKQCFFQKHILKGSPPPIERLPISEANGDKEDYMAIHDMAGLVACAQLGTLEFHTWGSKADKPEKPDLLVFDLDPDPSVEWADVALAAFAMRRKLDDLGFTSFLKTTGGKGLHVVVPIERRTSWDDVKAFTQAVSVRMEEEQPSLYTTNMAKAARKGKIFLDYLRNGRGATFVAPYSPRRRPGAPVATPITWEELARGIDPQSFTIASIPPRLAQLAEDPWAGMSDVSQSITAAAWKAVGGKP
jgi:bifunctional non-homologous end joining protein LigD